MKWLKKRIRNHFLQQRTQLQPSIIQHHEQKIAEQLFSLAQFQQATHIALYHPIGNEVPTQRMVDEIYRLNKIAYLPVLTNTKQLGFVRFEPNQAMIKNRLGVLEPQGELHAAKDLDLVLAPLVAFTKQGHRLGMGGGFYDTTFAYRQGQWAMPWLIGLAYECQKAVFVPYTNLDVKLDGIITETKVYGELENRMNHP